MTWCQANRRTDRRVRRALAEQHAITRAVYQQARPGINTLAPSSRPCVTAAFTLYSRILARIEDLDFEIFGHRATVGKPRRLAVAVAGISKAWVDRWHYLLTLGACLLITAPLEFFGGGVYRRPRRLAAALLPVAALFLVWDVIAVAGGVWWFNPLYITGVIAPGNLPLEEVLFFVVIPLCALLTYNAVDTILSRLRRRVQKSGVE